MQALNTQKWWDNFLGFKRKGKSQGFNLPEKSSTVKQYERHSFVVPSFDVVMLSVLSNSCDLFTYIQGSFCICGQQMRDDISNAGSHWLGTYTKCSLYILNWFLILPWYWSKCMIQNSNISLSMKYNQFQSKYFFFSKQFNTQGIKLQFHHYKSNIHCKILS